MALRLSRGFGHDAAETQFHEDAVLVGQVAAERARHDETLTEVELVSRLKGRVSPGLKAEFGVTTLLRHRDDVREHGQTGTPTAGSRRCAHGLDLAMVGRELL